MSTKKSFILKINPNNGTVVIPKQARIALGLPQTIILTVEDGEGKLEALSYTLDEVLYPQNQPKKQEIYEEKDFKEAIEEGIIARFKKSEV